MGLNKPGGGTLPTNTPHNDLINRTAVDSHPIGAITGLQADLDAKASAIATANSNSSTALSQSVTALTNSTEAETKSDSALLKIGTLANLQTSNKTDLVQALNENFINASNGKTAIASAVNGKGGTANASMTFSQLADAVTGIPNIDEATGDAVASNVLAGKTFSNDVGNGITGTMPNRAGDNVALTTSRSSTTFKMRPPEGYYDGVDDMVTHTDVDFIAGNIKSGINLFGIVGTLVEGKKFASMSFPSSNLASANWLGNANSELRQFNVAITGLAFRPNTMIVKQTGQYGGVTAYGMARNLDSWVAGVGASYNPNGGVSGAVRTVVNEDMFTADGIAINLSYYVISTSYSNAGTVLFTE